MTQMSQDILVLGAGMVGTCAALELRLRGHAVTLVDRQAPGRETSYGNAGIVQREAVEPYAFPRELPMLLSAALGRRLDVRWRLGGLLAAAPQLLRYWHWSAPQRHAAISRDYASLIARCTEAHQRYITFAGAEDLVRREGLQMVYRQPRALDAAVAEAERRQQVYGIRFEALDGKALAAGEPAFRIPLAGAVRWTDAWSVSDPGALVERYAAQFQQLGGRVVRGDADTLKPTAGGWQLATEDGHVQAAHAVIALGPWADRCLRRLGYRLPLFVKRGYHRHYAQGAALKLPTLDAERGYVLAPQQRGLRLSTGAEIASIDAPPNGRQITDVEAVARDLLDLGEPVEAQPWLGSRPCCADMKPVIGAAPRHRGLWFNFGHGHQGFTLGPASAAVLAEALEGRHPDWAVGFSPARFR